MAADDSYAAQSKRKSLLTQLKHIATEQEKGLCEQAEQYLDAYVVGFKKEDALKENKDTKLI